MEGLGGLKVWSLLWKNDNKGRKTMSKSLKPGDNCYQSIPPMNGLMPKRNKLLFTFVLYLYLPDEKLQRNCNWGLWYWHTLFLVRFSPLSLQIGILWSSNIKFKTSSFITTCGRAKKTNRLITLMNKIWELISKAHNFLFLFLVLLGYIIRIQTQKMMKTAADVPKF